MKNSHNLGSVSNSNKRVIKINMLNIIAIDFEIRTINIECSHREHKSNFDIFDAWTDFFLQCICVEYRPTLQ